MYPRPLASRRVQWLPWQEAAYAAAGAATATATLGRRAGRRARAAGAWARELAVMFGLYALWQLAGGLSLGQASGAVRRGSELLAAERWFHIPSEASVQRPFLSLHWLLRCFDVYYVVLHVVVTGACLIWVFSRHRDRYPVVRNTLALATGASLLVALVPVAPPRLVPRSGVVDVGRLVGPTVYPPTARPGLDQLSAMPSVHVAWAVVVAASVVYVLRSRWRWTALAYPVFTSTVVVVTGNHYYADGVVALAIVALAAWVSFRISGGRPHLVPGRASTTLPRTDRSASSAHAWLTSSSGTTRSTTTSICPSRTAAIAWRMPSASASSLSIKPPYP
jgi:hypothetical protein